jgi:hypothetical protein
MTRSAGIIADNATTVRAPEIWMRYVLRRDAVRHILKLRHVARAHEGGDRDDGKLKKNHQEEEEKMLKVNVEGG